MKDLEEELEKKNVEKMIVQDHLIQIVFSEEGKSLEDCLLQYLFRKC